ncbi:MAG: 3-dehydroquinate synthase [Deltaproteobacteria bacterium]|nr:3-dehydroquinate synthase [Deltaproteobacteria bacterium]
MVERLEITGATGLSTIAVGESIKNLGKYIPETRTVIITDGNVRALYGHDFPHCPVLEIGEGEKSKTLDTASRLYGKLVDMGADRSCFILGIGGGIVCDVAGFVASTYMRGVDFGFCPTTLLAQVDASVGGKNGVNYQGYKNMVGVFNQPSFVVCDPAVLKTLPKHELASGFAEIVKHGAIRSWEHFSYLANNVKKALALEPEVMGKLVFDSVSIKSQVVNEDEKEQGVRKILNFGHTFGHAIETVGKIPHGHAVSVGMLVAANLSKKREMIQHEDVVRLEKLLTLLGLPTTVDVDRQKAIAALSKDKKKQGDNIHFVLLKGIGEAVVEDIPVKELKIVI